MSAKRTAKHGLGPLLKAVVFTNTGAWCRIWEGNSSFAFCSCTVTAFERLNSQRSPDHGSINPGRIAGVRRCCQCHARDAWHHASCQLVTVNPKSKSCLCRPQFLKCARLENITKLHPNPQNSRQQLEKRIRSFSYFKLRLWATFGKPSKLTPNSVLTPN